MIQQNYSAKEIKELMHNLRRVFEIVRLVDPYVCDVCSDEKEEQSCDSCYQVWGKQNRCVNCISVYTVYHKTVSTKFEHIGDQVFGVTSRYVCVDGKGYALEMVNEVTNSYYVADDDDIMDLRGQLRCKIHALETDVLTQARNRSFLHNHFVEYEARALDLGGYVCMAFLDIDRFKTINDTYGHLYGDEVLKAFVAFWKRELPAENEYAVIRYGGDEFVVLAAEREYSRFLERMRRAHAALCASKAQYEENISASVGCVGVHCTQHQEDLLMQLIACADEQMYNAKRQGRNRLCETLLTKKEE